MSVITPENATQIEDRIKADVQREAEDSNPYLKVHWLRSLIAGFALRIYDFYLDLKRIELRLMPDTADSVSISKWGKIYVGNVNPATISSGEVIATGVSGSLISKDVILNSNDQSYVVSESSQISNNSIQVSSITRSANVATVTTTSNHNLSSFVEVTISGANESDYNGTFSISVQSETTFTFTVDNSPTTPATGSISAAFTSAVVKVKSSSFGKSTNLTADTPLTLDQPIIGVEDTLHVSQSQISGGIDEESESDYQNRYLEKIRNPSANFNKAKIIEWCKQITGVTRVWVEEAGDRVGTIDIASITRSGNIACVTTSSAHNYTDGIEVDITGAAQNEYNVSNKRIIIGDNTTFYYHVIGDPVTPATGSGLKSSAVVPLGQVRTFFMRDNDDEAIPSSSQVNTVKSKLEEIRPANTSSYDNIVQAPVAVINDFNFSNITPNTSTMRTAVKLNLDQFFEEEVNVNQVVDEDAYRAAISNTIDLATGDKLQSFVLDSPSGDLQSGSGKIERLGNVNF